MSIRLIHAKRIFSGKKGLEVRTRVWNPRKVRVRVVHVYVPELKSVIGSFTPGMLIPITKRVLSRMHRESRTSVISYLRGRPGFGIEIKSRSPTIVPRALESFGVIRAPQSWQYLKVDGSG